VFDTTHRTAGSCFSRILSITGVIFGAGSFSFGLYCWPLGEAAAAGGALARCEAAAGGALARREEEAAGGALARREEAVREEPGVLRGPPVVLRVLSEPAAGQEVYVEPGAAEPEYAGPVAVAF
jgi:hypothetical protein